MHAHSAHDTPHAVDDRSAFGTALHTVALGALLWHVFEHVRGTHRRRRSATPDAPPGRVQTWEGEGGNVDPAEAGAGPAG